MFWKNEEKKFLKDYNKHADAIYRYCFFRVYNKELAEDLTQETFVKTWKYIAKGGEIKNIKPFLYKTALNLIIDNSRKKKELSLDDISIKEREDVFRLNNIGKKEEEIFRRFEGSNLVKMLNQLSDAQKQVMAMRYIDDLLPAEIADILGESPNAVSVRINQATKRLRSIINEKKMHDNQ